MSPADIIARELGQDVDVQAIIRRRFGSDHDSPCDHPRVTTCAYWECQFANRCQGMRDPEKPQPPQIDAAIRKLAEEGT